jgi:hypothetical protein
MLVLHVPRPSRLWGLLNGGGSVNINLNLINAFHFFRFL